MHAHELVTMRQALPAGATQKSVDPSCRDLESCIQLTLSYVLLLVLKFYLSSNFL